VTSFLPVAPAGFHYVDNAGSPGRIGDFNRPPRGLPSNFSTSYHYCDPIDHYPDENRSLGHCERRVFFLTGNPESAAILADLLACSQVDISKFEQRDYLINKGRNAFLQPQTVSDCGTAATASNTTIAPSGTLAGIDLMNQRNTRAYDDGGRIFS